MSELEIPKKDPRVNPSGHEDIMDGYLPANERKVLDRLLKLLQDLVEKRTTQ